MDLLALHNEIFFLVAEFLQYDWNISSLSQVNRRLYLLLNSYVYEYNRSHFDSSLLRWAAEHGSEIVARKMLDIGAATAISDEQRLRVMRIAVGNGHVAVVQCFLERGIDLPRDLLLDAAKNGHLSVIQFMITRGEFPPSMSITKDTLSAAAGRGNLAVVKALVEGLWGRHLHSNSEYHNWRDTAASAMSYDAAINNQLEIVQYLVDLGVGPDDSNPLTAAATGGHHDVLHYLLTRGWDVNQSLADCFKPAIKNEHKSVLKLMLEHVNPDIFVLGNKKERRLLLFAAIACESEAYIGRLLPGGLSSR